MLSSVHPYFSPFLSCRLADRLRAFSFYIGLEVCLFLSRAAMNAQYPSMRRAVRTLSLAFPSAGKEALEEQAYLVSVQRRTIQEAVDCLTAQYSSSSPSPVSSATRSERKLPPRILCTTSMIANPHNAQHHPIPRRVSFINLPPKTRRAAKTVTRRITTNRTQLAAVAAATTTTMARRMCRSCTIAFFPRSVRAMRIPHHRMVCPTAPRRRPRPRHPVARAAVTEASIIRAAAAATVVTITTELHQAPQTTRLAPDWCSIWPP